MKEIVKVLLAEGIDEETIHEVLGIIEEKYEIVNEVSDDTVVSLYQKRKGNVKKADDKEHYMNTVGRTALQRAKADGDKEKVNKIKKAIKNSELEVAGAVSKALETQRAINKRQHRLGREQVNFPSL